MKITTQPACVTITLDPKDYWLLTNPEENALEGEYVLSHRIAMDYKGKEDQIGAIFMYLGESEAEVFRKAGFEELV